MPSKRKTPSKRSSKARNASRPPRASVSGRASASPALGVYTVAKKHVSIGVPTFWSLRQTNDDVQLLSPSGDTSVIVSAYERNGAGRLDAREYLQHFLETAPHAKRTQFGGASKGEASARFRDPEGNSWYVKFVTNGKVLLLAELSVAGPLTGREARTGVAVVDSLLLRSAR